MNMELEILHSPAFLLDLLASLTLFVKMRAALSSKMRLNNVFMIDSNETIGVVKILRVLRVLRPLRAINRAKGLKVS